MGKESKGEKRKDKEKRRKIKINERREVEGREKRND